MKTDKPDAPVPAREPGQVAAHIATVIGENRRSRKFAPFLRLF